MKSKYKYKKSTSRALKTRGGFSIPRTPRAYTINRVKQAVEAKAGKAAGEFAAMKAAEAWDHALKRAANLTFGGGKTAGTQQGQPDGVANSNAATVPFVQSDSLRSKSGSNQIQMTKQYKTNYVFGRPASLAIKNIAKTYGTTKLDNFNTMNDFKSLIFRPYLSSKFGFNQKNCMFLSQFFMPNVQALHSTYGLSDWTTPESTDQRAYGMMLSMKQVTTFSNSNSFFPIKFKVHLVAPNDLEYNGLRLAEVTFNAVAAGQYIGTIPKRYQYSDRYASTDIKFGAICDRKMRPTMSPTFRERANIVKTFTKKLAPGDTWELSLKELCGAGIDLAVVQSSWGQDFRSTAGYVVYVETEGIPCEAVKQGQFGMTEGTYLGTSPGYFNMESRSEYELCNNPNIVLGTGPADGYKAPFGVRLFQVLPKLQKPYNVNAEEIGDPGEGGKTMFIPLITDKTVKYADPATNT